VGTSKGKEIRWERGGGRGGFCSTWNLGITFVSIIYIFTHPHFLKSLNANISLDPHF